MLINQIICFLPPICLISLLLEVQQQKFRKTIECCICRQNINNNEEIVVCPFCQTIYHRLHLSLWLKIKKKCPICKNGIKNHYKSYYIDTEDNLSLNTIDMSQFNLISCENRHIVNIHTDFVLECPHCKNILNSSIYGVLSQCQICGSYISWIDDLESRIKNLDISMHYEKKRINKLRISRNTEGNNRKINYRIIKRQKEKKRDYFRRELQKQAQLESQDQTLLLNQDYLRRQTQQPCHRQYHPLRIIEYVEKKENPRKMNFWGLESFITLILVIIIFIFVTIL